MVMLKTDRAWWIVFLLNIVTCGIYNIYFFYKVGEDLNHIISGRDGEKTLNYLWVGFILGSITCGIAELVWRHKKAERMKYELAHRGIDYRFGAETFWIFAGIPVIAYLVLYLAQIFVNPLLIPFPWWILVAAVFMAIMTNIYLHKLCTAMNELADDFNHRGWEHQWE